MMLTNDFVSGYPTVTGPDGRTPLTTLNEIDASYYEGLTNPSFKAQQRSVKGH